MKILVVGGGGREHALCWKIAQSPMAEKVFCAPGNAGIAQVAQCVDISPDDIEKLAKFALGNSIDLTVVGPELPLSIGIVDRFSELGLLIFGPDKMASEIESSKVFSKQLMSKYGIPSAGYTVFENHEDAVVYIGKADYPLVIKADGLAAGKGVFICDDEQSAHEALQSIMKDRTFGDSGSKVVIEQYLDGEEASFFVLTDGERIIPLETSQDHKAIYDGDKGPNTGGMGAYSPAPVIDSGNIRNKIMEEIALPTLRAMEKEGRPYRGVLYIGLMINDSEPKVLEYNCRFGDPEAQPILARLDCDIVPFLESVAKGKLHSTEMKWKDKASVCVVMASQGYPGKYEKGMEIKNIDKLDNISDIYLFHSGTKLSGSCVVTDGGRVLGVTALADTISGARDLAYRGVELIDNDFLYYRKDIASKAIKSK